MPEQFVRWYDQDPLLSRAFAAMQQLPLDVLLIMAKLLLTTEEGVKLDQKRSSQLRSLGVDRTVGLIKSKQRNRWYDKDPLVHRAVNFIYVCNPSMRHILAEQLNSLINAYDLYLDTCQSKGKSVDLRDVENLFQYVYHRNFESLEE